MGNDVLYEIYTYNGKKESDQFRTGDFPEFAKEIARLAKIEDRGDIYVSSKEMKHSPKRK